MTEAPTRTIPEATFRSDSDVQLVNCEASDLMVVQAARVSTIGAESIDTTESAGLIDYLLRSRHGSPFESSYFRFLIRTPIFVAREFMRHRIASYSERSARYSELQGEFYIPGPNRAVIQVGKQSQYQMINGTKDNLDDVREAIKSSSEVSWGFYQLLLEAGYAKEVARMVLPVNIFTEFYVSMNARGLMNFLSLRVKDEFATYETNPLYEIQQVAEKMESDFSVEMPYTHMSFIKHGRVAP